MKNLIFTSIFSIFLTLSWIGDVVNAATHSKPKNYIVDRAVDIMLLAFEQTVRKGKSEEFGSYFSDSFDSDAWYDRYYSELSPEKLQTFVLRRFGHVESRGANYQFKFSESHNTTNGLLLRSFITWTKSTPTNAFAIDGIHYYGEY
uniref:DUF4019 domain-containing protein n=1 Tax=Caenorhabditis japonica TaxID=281687 RepID=A0A8R1E415_CAEJA